MRPGYKLTEVGVIPEGWGLRTMDSLTSLMTNGFVGTATSAYVDGDDGVLYVQGYNVKENGFNFHGIKRVSRSFHARNQKSCLRPGDLLTIQTGDIGVTAIVPPSLAGANCHALVISRMDNRASEPNFYCQYFNSERGRAQLKEIETGSTMKHLNVGDMKLLLLPSPPVEEQRAIAEALSNVDALLAGLDRLIAKKRDLKQAAMQQLLTGQTRLSGFQGEWESRPLSSAVADLEAGVSVNSVAGASYAISGEPGILKTSCVADGKFDPSEYKLIDPREIGRARLSLRGGTLIISRMNTPNLVGEVGFVGQDYPNLFLPDRLWMTRFRPDSGLCPKWLAYLMSSPTAQAAIKDLASGTSGSMKNIAKSKLLKLSLDFPSTDEQVAIAAVLSDMDAELTSLEARRDKTRALKQGMMQELLTGRTRLI